MIQPAQWNAHRYGVAPEWQAFWYGLSGAWLFNEGGGPDVRDYSGYENHLTPEDGAPAWEMGPTGRVSRLTEDSLTTGATVIGGTNLFADNAGKWTVAVKCSFPGPSGADGYIFSRAGATGADRVIGLISGVAELALFVRGSETQILADASYADGEEHVFVVKWDGESGAEARVYIDGIFVGSGGEGSATDSADPLLFGARGGGFIVDDMSLSAALVWSRPLTDNEIAKISSDVYGPFRPDHRPIVMPIFNPIGPHAFAAKRVVSYR